MALYAVSNGYLDEIPLTAVGRWGEEFQRYMNTARSEVGQAIRENADIGDTEDALKEAIHGVSTRASRHDTRATHREESAEWLASGRSGGAFAVCRTRRRSRAPWRWWPR